MQSEAAKHDFRVKSLCPVITEKGYPFDTRAVQTYGPDIFKKEHDRKKNIWLPSPIARTMLHTWHVARNAEAAFRLSPILL